MAKKTAKEAPQHGKNDRPIIIIKKVKGHAAHHGGAWKVAYADFVTAMMALFLVLWILGNSNSKEKAVIAHYFREPGVFTGSRGVVPRGGEDKLGAGIIQAPSMEVLRAALKDSVAALKDLIGEEQVPITITEDGVLIEIIDKDKQAFFELSSAAIKPTMRKVLELIVKQVKEMPNQVVVSGHTDARPYHDESFYSNWELSTSRALKTRQVLQQLGLPSERFEQVSGYADRKLRDPANPLSSENRRISILIKKLSKEPTPAKAETQPPAAPQKPAAPQIPAAPGK